MATSRILFVAFVLALTFVDAKISAKALLPLSNRLKFRTASVNVRDTASEQLILRSDNYVISKGSAEDCYDVTFNDNLPNSSLINTLEIGEQPHNGVARVNSNHYICYKPNPYFSGVETFSYTIKDGNEYEWASVKITVSSAGGKAPVAVDDSAEVKVDEYSIVIDVLNNDYDEDGPFVNAASLRILQQPRTIEGGYRGTAYVNTDFQIVYEPVFIAQEVRFFGSDSIIYEICDPIDPSSCSIATVNIIVKDKCLACERCSDLSLVNKDHAEWISSYYSEDVISKISA